MGERIGGRRRRWAAFVLLVLSLALLNGTGSADGPAGPKVKALFFGDSLIVGTGALPVRPVQVHTAASRLEWIAVVDGFGGTGYTTGASRGKPYLERLRTDGYLHTPYDVIVLEGGTNDAHHGSLTSLRASALRTVDYVQQRQPWARIVLVGGYAPSGVPLERYQRADSILAGVAASRGLRYVSQLHYSQLTDSAFLSPDRLHPSTAGYRLMGADLARALRE